ncbi:conserved hypothetical protein [Frankia canadensis]|uniref:DUF664 domain-containing protein n=1 Tax=Frankia canadensis TaxID=1836972 RepID=A0A2I2KVX0_9ACTN|nr:conserved hypothetical protein [Frankia canadensis]SOU57094.1 conserved hypothetical protein [Frankia canadensis]
MRRRGEAARPDPRRLRRRRPRPGPHQPAAAHRPAAGPRADRGEHHAAALLPVPPRGRLPDPGLPERAPRPRPRHPQHRPRLGRPARRGAGTRPVRQGPLLHRRLRARRTVPARLDAVPPRPRRLPDGRHRRRRLDIRGRHPRRPPDLRRQRPPRLRPPLTRPPDRTRAPWFPAGATRSARQVLMHIIGETAQHSGHADILREAIDGTRTMG